jgi:hypothetical protein
MNLAAYTPPSAGEHASFLVVIALVAILLFVGFMAITRRNHTHREFVPGDVRRDLHAIGTSINGIPKIRVTQVDPVEGIRAKRTWSEISIRVQLRQAEPAMMEVTVTIRTSGGDGMIVSQVMQAIYSAQERLIGGGPAPFGPTVPT